MKKQILSYLSLGQICDVQSGGTPSRHINAYWEKGNIPWVKISDIKGKHLLGTDEYITRQGLENSSAKIFPKGTILYTIFATLGETTILNIDAATNQAIAGINIHDQYKKIILTDYLYYYLLSIKDIMCKVGRGVAQNNLNLKILRNVQVPVPTIEEQKKIIDTLSSIEKIMLVKDRQLSLLSNLVKSRFLEMFGMSEGIDKHLEDVADICSGITKGRKVLGLELREVPYMAVSNVKMGYIDLSTVKTIMATENEIEQYRLFPNDILMTEGGDPDKVGRGAIIRNPPKDCIHQNHIFRVRLHKDVLLPEFFEEYLQGNSARRYFLKAAKQTTGIASINMKQLRALPVKIPPIKVQIQYSDFVHQVDKSKYGGPIFLRLLEDIRICCNI